MKQIFTMMMALLTGAVSMSALGLGIYGAEGSTRFELGETRNEEAPDDKDQDGTSRIHFD